jgi:phage terminase large subunit-like protein
MDVLENELKKFPRGKNDDVIDALQMLYDMYTLQPNTPKQNTDLKIERDQYGNVV